MENNSCRSGTLASLRAASLHPRRVTTMGRKTKKALSAETAFTTHGADADFDTFVAEWKLGDAVATQLQQEGFVTKTALLGMSDDDITDFELKKGERAALQKSDG